MNLELTQDQKSRAVNEVIRSRKTLKVLADPLNPIQWDDARITKRDQVVMASIASAGWAPFHYDRGQSGIVEPWRVDWLNHESCRHVAAHFREWFDDVKPGNKLPGMLSACGSLVLVSWLPQFEQHSESSEMTPAKQRLVDEEHLAATAAYVQNLLLLLTAEGLGTYWSSGGQFRTPVMFEKLGMDHGGKLLAAIFVDYSDGEDEENPSQNDVERIPGKHRDRRSSSESWCRSVRLT